VTIYQITPVVVAVPAEGWISFDCFSDSTVPGNVLTGPSEISTLMTPAYCALFCGIDYQFSGVENSRHLSHTFYYAC
jgi:hypothetical protein